MGFMLEVLKKIIYILPWLNMPKYGQKRAKK